MTTNHHTPIPTGSAANAATFNPPLGELDAELTSQRGRIAVLEGEALEYSGNANEFLNGQGQFTVPAGGGGGTAGHAIKDEGVALPQRANLDFVGGGVTVSDTPEATRVTIPNDHGGQTGLLDDDHPQYMLRADVRTQNILINGGFDLAQRQAPGTLTTIADNKYGADRWRSTRENADLQYQRIDATGETGLTSKYYGLFKKITNAGKFLVFQAIEGVNSVPYRGKTVIFQLAMKASSAKTIRMAMLELQNAGTMDSLPAALVTAWGADTVDPTLGANVAVITAAQSKSVTTSWQIFSVSVTIPSNSKNLICAFWSDSDFAVNDTLAVAEAGFYPGTAVLPWNPRLIQQEIALCQRYCTKSYPLDVAPGTSGIFSFIYALSKFPTTTRPFDRFPVTMRATPTVTLYSLTGTAGKIADMNGTDVGTSVTSTVDQSRNITLTDSGSGFTVDALYIFHYVADAEL
jgi:hypothetical protein